MYKIILVDDEPLILAGISSLIKWENAGFTIVGKASNGKNAFDLIKDLSPDLVITDIKMPVMTGIELIQKCKDEQINCNFILLTNLEEFSLVKQAISLNVSDYLIKIDLTPDMLKNALLKVKSTLDSQSNAIYDINQKSNKFLNKNSFFEDILKNNYTTEDINSKLDIENIDFFNINENFTLISLTPKNPLDFNANVQDFKINEFNYHSFNIISEISSRFFNNSFCINYKSNIILLIVPFKNNDFKNNIITFCNKCNNNLKTYFEYNCIFGISNTYNLSNIYIALDESLKSLNQYYYKSSSNILFFDQCEFLENKSKNFNISFLKNDLEAIIYQNNTDAFKDIFDKLIELFKVYKPNKDYITSASINLYSYIQSFFEEDEEYNNIFIYSINIAEFLNNLQTLDDILKWLNYFQNNVSNILISRKEGKTDRLVDMAKKYINENYTEKLTLTDISNKLNINSSYLSSIFKKNTGVNLFDYIAYVKIEHSKELIKTHKYLMYEISDMLGFDNPYYFSKVFKKIIGVSPKEFENMNTKL